MPLAYAPSYPTFMSIPNAQMMSGQIMSGMGGFGDYLGQSMGQQIDYMGQQMGQQMLPTMAGVRPYTAAMNTGIVDQSRYVMQPVQQVQQIPVVQQQLSQVQPPPRAMEPAARVASPSNKALKQDNETLRAQNIAMSQEIEDLKGLLKGTRAQLDDLIRRTEAGSSSPMPTPSTIAPRPTTSTPKRATTPVSGTEENLRAVGGSGSQLLHASASASYHGRFPSASRSNNSLSTSRSGTVSTGARPAWKTMNAQSSPLSIGAQFRQIPGPNGSITLGITRLAMGGPAESAGLRLGDILEECEYKIIDNEKSMVRRLSGCGFSKNALQKSLSTLKTGEEVKFAVNRDGERFEVWVSLVPIDHCEWSAEGEFDRSFTPNDDTLNESVIPVMTEFSELELSVDEKPKSQRWEAGWQLNFDAFLRYCINEAKIHVGEDFVHDTEAMQKFEDACRACELQLIKEGHGDVRLPSLWNNRDLILHVTGQQCEDQGLLLCASF